MHLLIMCHYTSVTGCFCKVQNFQNLYKFANDVYFLSLIVPGLYLLIHVFHFSGFKALYCGLWDIYSQNGNSVHRFCADISITTHHIGIPIHRGAM